MEEFVVETLLSGDGGAQIQGAIELSKLGSKQRQKLADRGVVPPLISMLHSQDYGATEASLFALLALAFGSERNKIQIVKGGAIPAMLNLLRSRSLVELTATALLVLSSCAANKLPIASSGAIETLIAIISGETAPDPPQVAVSPQTELDAVSTLLNLSTAPRIASLIVASGGVPALLDLIVASGSPRSPEAAEKAMAALENAVAASASSGRAVREVARHGGAIRALVEAVEEGSPECREHAVAVLLAVVRSCREEHREAVLREGAVPGLLQLSVDGTGWAKEMAQHLLLLLRDDCSADCGGGRAKQQQQKKKTKKRELVEQVMEEIDAEGASLRLVEEMVAKLKLDR
ncbi:hypothetical protein ACJRO7_005176 [Eucalyptus globulus]|uniref:U-box domain-containing protein n=1 Tax=Eucalyptus globulus TaxID=34317 RepID=A0ABD3IYP4_EUCGL